jgi:uncharacterized membrane protein YfcA
MKQLYANKWYWYIGALLCGGLGVYWFVHFISSHTPMDLFVGIVTLVIGIYAFWRAQHPSEQEPDRTHTS